MAFKISDDCISCGACAAECPVGAISEGDGKFVIDADTCISCGVCISECPQEAITPDDEADEKWVKFNAENAANWPNANE